MAHLYDINASKKAANLSINSDLLQKAKAQGINLSSTLEEALKELLVKQTQEDWKRENADAIKANCDFIGQNGCFGRKHRVF
ncbi:MAG: type II toxin-antitoxin system CcdA family antitoxin [Hydrogenovibrio sp.]